MTAATHPRVLLALLCAAQFLVVLDMTIVNVAVPELRAELELPGRAVHWVMTAYAVAFGGFLLVGGRAADAFGRRRMLVVGGAVFTAASLACGLAPSGSALIAARAAQGLGGALLSTAAFGLLLAVTAPGSARTGAIAAWGSIGALGAVSGFVVGGVLTELLGWRAIFFAVVPVGAALVVLAPRLLPPSRAERRPPVDAAAGALATAGVATVAFVVTAGPASGWSGAHLPLAALAGTALLAAFAVRERRTAEPLVPTRIVADRGFAAAGLAGAAYGATMVGILVLLAVYLQVGRGVSPLATGLLLLLVRAPSIGWARLAGRLVARYGAQPFVVLGSLLLAAGALLLAGLPARGSYALPLLVGVAVLGGAIPLTAVSVASAAVGGVEPDDAGVASGLLSTCQWVGGALGFAVVSAVAGDPYGTATGSARAVVASVHAGFLACAGLCLLAAIVALAAARRPRLVPAAAAR